MKVAVAQKVSKKPDLIIPLIEEEDCYKLSKENATSWELKTNPGAADSPTYKLMVHVLEGNETARQTCRWRNEVLKVCRGSNATDRETRQPIMEACMRPGPRSIFLATLQAHAEQAYRVALQAAIATDTAAGDSAASDAVRAQGVDHYRTNDHLDIGLREVVTNLLPRKVLAKVKRNLRRDMRKPLDMKVRPYYQALMRINDEELDNLPPFAGRQHLSADEMLDILLFGTPRSWQTEMDRQGFDPMDAGLMATVDFMENIEDLEEKPAYQEVKGKNRSKKDSSSKEKDDTSSPKKKAPYYCKKHGPNYTHDTADCRVLKKEKGNFSNKTWSRKAEEDTASSKKELAALVAKAVKKEVKAGVKKQLASLSKKRKSSKDDESDEECCLVQMLESKLDGFNYQQMENLTISDEASC